jgi:hypothetical protein
MENGSGRILNAAQSSEAEKNVKTAIADARAHHACMEMV